jgi:porin
MSIRRRGLQAIACLSCATFAVASEPHDYFGPSDWEGVPVALTAQASPSDMPTPAAPPSPSDKPAPTPARATSVAPYCYEPAPPAVPSICERATLLGEWCGVRPCLAESGVVVQADVTQFYYGVVSGGLDREFRYAGHGDYVANFDGQKLIGAEGLFLKIRAEHRFGESLAGATGAIYPSNVLADLPTNNDNLYMTDFTVTQALSEEFAIYGGKLDLLDADANAFAHGRGKTQFSNVAFVINPALLQLAPYSTIAGGFVIMDEGQPILNVGILSPNDATKGTGLQDAYEDGVILTAELRKPTDLYGFDGHFLVGGVWNNKEFITLGQDPRIVLPDVPIDQQRGSWGFYSNFDQYLVHYDDSKKTGWGIFGRASVTDRQVNLTQYFLSAGIGGNSPICGRQADTFGVGYYYAGSSSEIGDFIEAAFGPIGDGQGVELYYNAQVTPWLHVTPDLQILDSAREDVDTVLVAGVRANVAL